MDSKLLELARCRSHVGLIMIFIAAENSKKTNCNFHSCPKFPKVCCRSRRIEKNSLRLPTEERSLFIAGRERGGFTLYYSNDPLSTHFILALQAANRCFSDLRYGIQLTLLHHRSPLFQECQHFPLFCKNSCKFSNIVDIQ